MAGAEPRISDEAVREKTGRDWAEWEMLLDEAGAADLSHKEIVALLRDRGLIENGWWRQMVTSTYEKLKGRRKLGETADTGFQVGVQRTVDAPAELVWRVLTSPAGVRAWLGDSDGIRFEKGETYELDDGSTGEVRVVRPEQRVRLTWQPGGWPRASTIQAHLTAKGDRTVIGFHEEHLPGAEERVRRRAHFKTAANALERLLADARSTG